MLSFQRILDLKANAAILANVTKMEAPDKATVKLTLGKPNADLLANLGGLQGKIVPRELGERNGGLEGPPAIGTGPWIYEKWVVASDNYPWDRRRSPDVGQYLLLLCLWSGIIVIHLLRGTARLQNCLASCAELHRRAMRTR